MRDLNPIPSKLTTITTAVTLSLFISSTLLLLQTRSRKTNNKPPYIPSPPKTFSERSRNNNKTPPYPPEDALPGARDVATPYGSIRVYEWGPDGGGAERGRVLLVHGISTPVVALGDLGHELVARGYRVMMFDLFGRGYSDAPTDLPYDARLYTTQILLVLASSPSPIPWTSPSPSPPPTATATTSPTSGFHLIGYSLGGGLSVSFARYFPHLLRSLVLIAPCGLIRAHHVGWRSWLYYNSGLLPECLVRYLVRPRIRPKDTPPVPVSKPVCSAVQGSESALIGTGITGAGSGVGAARVGLGEVGGDDILAAEEGNPIQQQQQQQQQQQGESTVRGDSDANGGANFNSASISKHKPHITVSSVVSWQVDQHKGFLDAFLSTIRLAPIYAPQEDWQYLSRILESRPRRLLSSEREGDEEGKGGEGGEEGEAVAVAACEKETTTTTTAGLDGGKICLVLGKDDGVVVLDEIIADAEAVLGRDGIEVVALEGGHELPFTSSARVVESIEGFWKSLE